jgi:hypothetical protein
MSPDTKVSATIPRSVALICALIIVVVLASAIYSGIAGTAPASFNTSAQPAPITIPQGLALPTLPAITCPLASDAAPSPVAPDTLASSTLILTHPDAADLVPYTVRGFSPAQTASIAWWMCPGFADNTTEFRSYERKSPEIRETYPEEERIFFSFISDNLDTAESQSVIHTPLILFRGISPNVAAMVINNAEYREPAFASTSYDITVCLDLFGAKSPDGYRNVLVMERQPGDHLLFINNDEREFLLPRDKTWYVVKSIKIENLTVNADFPLHDRKTTTASFDHIRLIYIKETTCSRTGGGI